MSLTVLALRKKQSRLVGVSGSSRVRHPVAVAVGGDGSIYVGDNEQNAVLVFDKDERFSRAIGHEKSYHAAYRFGRAPAALLEAQIDAKYEVWVSRQAAGGAPGTSTYSPTFNEVLRRVIVRRTPD